MVQCSAEHGFYQVTSPFMSVKLVSADIHEIVHETILY